MLAVLGDTEIAVTVAPPVDTVRSALPLIPESVAVTVVDPAAIPSARPAEFTVATDWLASDQVAIELTFAVEPSLYFAVATNCSVAPAAMVAVPGVTETDVIVFVCEPDGEPVPPHPVNVRSETENNAVETTTGRRRVVLMLFEPQRTDTTLMVQITLKVAAGKGSWSVPSSSWYGASLYSGRRGTFEY